MKKLLFAMALIGSQLTAAAKAEIEIDPPHWWTGMNSTQLQLQVHAPSIRDANVTIDYPGVTIDSVARLDKSPNWQYIYLTVAPETKPGNIKINWKEGKRKFSKTYELKERKFQKGAKGFDSSDVLYLIMPDRFADGNPDNNIDKSMDFPVGADRTDPNTRHGGDIKGIADHIDYLDELGITAVWVNPVLENDMPGGAYHGYATTDYYKIDPRLGTNSEYVQLIDTLHQHSIKTVMDMIFNHSGSNHPWRLDPPASDWFNCQDEFIQTNYKLQTITDPYSSDYDRNLTLKGWFVRDMPDLNQNNPHLMKYLSQNSIWWIEEAQLDGIRMDTYAYADQDEMAKWIDAIIAEYPDFDVVGECWLPDTAGIAYWQTNSAFTKPGHDTKLQVIMDFPLMLKVRDMEPFRQQTTYAGGMHTLYDHLALDYSFADPNKVLRFLDNHDTERFIVTEPDNLDQWKQALAFLLTIPGIPQLYYGTELLMSGTRQGGDGNIRKDMPGGFPGDTISIFNHDGRTTLQNEAFDYISKINNWRKTSKAVTKGTMKHFIPNEGVYIYERKSPDQQVIVMLNGTEEEVTLPLKQYVEILNPEATYKDVVSGEIITLNPSGTHTFSPRETRILQRL